MAIATNPPFTVASAPQLTPYSQRPKKSPLHSTCPRQTAAPAPPLTFLPVPRWAQNRNDPNRTPQHYLPYSNLQSRPRKSRTDNTSPSAAGKRRLAPTPHRLNDCCTVLYSYNQRHAAGVPGNGAAVNASLCLRHGGSAAVVPNPSKHLQQRRSIAGGVGFYLFGFSFRLVFRLVHLRVDELAVGE